MKSPKAMNIGENPPHPSSEKLTPSQILDDRWMREAAIGVAAFRQIRDPERYIDNQVLSQIGHNRWCLALQKVKGPVLSWWSWKIYLEKTIQISPGDRVSAQEVYYRFTFWFQRRNPDCPEPPSKFMFGRYMSHSKFDRAIIGGRTFYQNIKLIEEKLL